MEKMKRIAVLSDLSGLGRCSLTAALPVISVMGVQACPIPTAILSNQTGYDSSYVVDMTKHLGPYMKEWTKRGMNPDGIYCGYLASAGQAEEALRFLETFRGENTKVLVDPIMGDNGSPFPFYSRELGEKYRLLVKAADVIKPNLTEAVMLTESVSAPMKDYARIFTEQEPGRKYLKTVEGIGKELLEKYQLKTVVITGVNFYNEEKGFAEVANLIANKDGVMKWVYSPKYGGSYSGTGDLFASVLSVGMAKGRPLELYVEKAVHFLEYAIRDSAMEGTDRNEGVAFERYLHMLWEM